MTQNYGSGVCIPYAKLEREEIFAMLRLRQDVFIVEQDCIYQDIDQKDAASAHFFLWEAEPASSALMK